MEYRRRRRKRRFAATEGSGTARAIAALLVVAAVVYLISASAAGTWIAQKVMAPAFAAFDNMIQRTASTKTPEVGETSTPRVSASNEKTVTGDVELPAMACFALQMGVYSDKNNADSQAQALQQRGAGGYVMEDAGRYRVLAAAYQTQESLKQVRDQLTAEGLESATYTFSAPVSTLRVTATQSQLDGIASSFNALNTLQQEMAAAVLLFDQQQLSADKGRETASELLNKLQAASEAFLSSEGDDNPVLQATRECFAKYDDAIRALADYNSQSFVDFSAKMKYTHICIAHAYATLAQEISSMA